MNKETMIIVLVFVVGSLQSIVSDIVHIKPAASIKPEEKTNDNNPSASADGVVSNSTSPCDRHLRSAEVEVRNPRNHKFVTSNGWTDRQRPRPEINVYSSRIEELPSPQPSAATPKITSTSEYYQQQRNSLYHESRQQQPPTVRTSKRIIYYATLPDVIRPPSGYPPLPSYSAAEPYGLGPGPYSADFRQLDSNRNGPDGSQRNRLLPYENAYNRGNGVTSVTSKSVSTVYNGKYDEPAEFRESYYRPNEFTSKFASWAEPFYKSWSSSSLDKEPPSYSNNRGLSSFSWDREPVTKGGSSWDNRGSSWDNRGSSWDNRGSSWDSRGFPWENRGSSWDKELVEVPLQKPNGVGSRGGDGGNNFNSDKYPEVAIVQSGVIDVRGDRKQNVLPLSPPPKFTIVDVDPKPYYQPQQMRYDDHIKPMQHNMQYEPPMQHMQYEPSPQKPMRYEAYTPMEPPTRFEQQQPPLPPSSMRYEQQYRPSSSSSTQHGQQQNHNREPSNNRYYETIKNNIRTHQFMTSWTEMSNQDDVSPTHSSADVEIISHGNSTSVQNNTNRVANTTKVP